jgi:hypothetical protein
MSVRLAQSDHVGVRSTAVARCLPTTPTGSWCTCDGQPGTAVAGTRRTRSSAHSGLTVSVPKDERTPGSCWTPRVRFGLREQLCCTLVVPHALLVPCDSADPTVTLNRVDSRFHAPRVCKPPAARQAVQALGPRALVARAPAPS